MKSRTFAELLIVIIPLFLLPVQIKGVHAAGTLYPDPPSVVPQDLNTTFDIAIRVGSMDSFNAWDIQASANQSVIVAQSVSIAGSVLGTSAFEVAHCVNGVGSCYQGDGPGVVHSSVTSLGTLVSGDGLLFTITYKVVGVGYSGIHLFNDRIVSGQTSSRVPHSTVDSVYGTPGINPDFLFFGNQTFLTVTQGQSENSTLELDSSNGFSGNVMFGFTTSIGGSAFPVKGLRVSVNPSTVFVSTGASSTVVVEISANASTPTTQVTVTITAKSGPLLSHSVDLYVSLSSPGSFLIDARPGLLILHARDTGYSTILLSSQVEPGTHNQFSGQVELTAQVIPIVGPLDANATATLSMTSLMVSPDINAKSTLTVKTPFSGLPFHYIIRVKGTSGSLSASVDVGVLPPPPDFNFTVNPGSLSTHAGHSGTFQIKLVSTDYFQNTVYLYASALSGTKLSFTPANLTLKGLEVYDHTLSATLNVTTDPTLSNGIHPVFLTATASDFRSTVTHSLTVNVTIEQVTSAPPPVQVAPKNILGLDPLLYFGIIGALIVGLAAMTVLEVRRGRRPMGTLGERMGSTQILSGTEDLLASKKG